MCTNLIKVSGAGITLGDVLEIGAYLTGAAGRSQELRNAFNETRRRDGNPLLFERQLQEDTESFIQKQEKDHFDFVIDPSLNAYYLFQALAENVPGIEEGPQEPWFHRNVFYWRPQITESLDLAIKNQKVPFSTYPQKELLIKTGKAMAILPSPYTLLELSDIATDAYSSKNNVLIDLAHVIKNEATLLAEAGFKRIQYDEPAIVKRQSNGSLEAEHIDLLNTAFRICGTIPEATTSIHTYFGNAGKNEAAGKESIIPYLFALPVDCVGVDVTWTPPAEVAKFKTNGKELALGFFDADTVYEENQQWIGEQVALIAKRSKPSKVYITPNTGMDYIGATEGTKKTNLLKNTQKWVTNYLQRMK